jgi:hypothetical protein
VVLADHSLTGWVEWVAPNTKSVVDLRAELFTPDTLREFSRALEGRPGWREFVALHHVDLVVVARSSPLNELLRNEGWRSRSSSPEFVLYAGPSPSRTP